MDHSPIIQLQNSQKNQDALFAELADALLHEMETLEHVFHDGTSHSLVLETADSHTSSLLMGIVSNCALAREVLEKIEPEVRNREHDSLSKVLKRTKVDVTERNTWLHQIAAYQEKIITTGSVPDRKMNVTCHTKEVDGQTVRQVAIHIAADAKEYLADFLRGMREMIEDIAQGYDLGDEWVTKAKRIEEQSQSHTWRHVDVILQQDHCTDGTKNLTLHIPNGEPDRTLVINVLQDLLQHHENADLKQVMQRKEIRRDNGHDVVIEGLAPDKMIALSAIMIGATESPFNIYVVS